VFIPSQAPKVAALFQSVEVPPVAVIVVNAPAAGVVPPITASTVPAFMSLWLLLKK